MIEFIAAMILICFAIALIICYVWWLCNSISDVKDYGNNADNKSWVCIIFTVLLIGCCIGVLVV